MVSRFPAEPEAEMLTMIAPHALGKVHGTGVASLAAAQEMPAQMMSVFRREPAPIPDFLATSLTASDIDDSSRLMPPSWNEADSSRRTSAMVMSNVSEGRPEDVLMMDTLVSKPEKTRLGEIPAEALAELSEPEATAPKATTETLAAHLKPKPPVVDAEMLSAIRPDYEVDDAVLLGRTLMSTARAPADLEVLEEPVEEEEEETEEEEVAAVPEEAAAPQPIEKLVSHLRPRPPADVPAEMLSAIRPDYEMDDAVLLGRTLMSTARAPADLEVLEEAAPSEPEPAAAAQPIEKLVSHLRPRPPADVPAEMLSAIRPDYELDDAVLLGRTLMTSARAPADLEVAEEKAAPQKEAKRDTLKPPPKVSMTTKMAPSFMSAIRPDFELEEFDEALIMDQAGVAVPKSTGSGAVPPAKATSPSTEAKLKAKASLSTKLSPAFMSAIRSDFDLGGLDDDVMMFENSMEIQPPAAPPVGGASSSGAAVPAKASGKEVAKEKGKKK
eukprot:EG_transcript_6840